MGMEGNPNIYPWTINNIPLDNRLHVGIPAAPMGLQICLIRILMVYMRDSDMVMNNEYSRYRATLIVPGLPYYSLHVSRMMHEQRLLLEGFCREVTLS